MAHVEEEGMMQGEQVSMAELKEHLLRRLDRVRRYIEEEPDGAVTGFLVILSTDQAARSFTSGDPRAWLPAAVVALPEILVGAKKDCDMADAMERVNGSGVH